MSENCGGCCWQLEDMVPCGRGLWPWQQFKESAMTTFLLQEEVVFFISCNPSPCFYRLHFFKNCILQPLCVIKIFPPFVL